MKGHKFKLEAVLKLRKIKEDVCKMELGQIQMRINQLDSFKSGHQVDIEKAYQDQELRLKSGLTVHDLRNFPIMIEEKREHIERIESEIEDLKVQSDTKIQELAKLKGDVKVIANMKEKSINAYKKEINKKMNENLEEQTQNWNLLKEII